MAIVRWAVALGVVLALLGLTDAPARAHADLERASPAPDGLLDSPPDAIELWFTEPVEEGAGSPSIELYDDAGDPIGGLAPRIDPNDPRHLTVPLELLGPGTYTVGWSVRSATDGHTLSGTFAFRVGGGRAPGAAQVQGETPATWAVATRWLTWLGIALVAGGAFFSRIVLRGRHGLIAATSRRRDAILAGAAMALVATLAEPVAIAIDLAREASLPEGVINAVADYGPGDVVSAIPDALRTLPDAWWLRLAAVVLLPVAIVLTQPGRRDWRFGPIAEWAMLGLGLLGLLGLSLTGHAAGRADLRALAVGSNIIHQWAVALWVGGLAHLALGWVAQRPVAPLAAAELEGLPAPVSGGSTDATTPVDIDPVRRFSRIALGLVVVGVGTGILNSTLLLPRVAALWESDYGRVLLLKVLALVPVLALATFHRAALARATTKLGSAVLAARTVRIEAVLVPLVVLGGSVLALLAPPGTRAGGGDLAMVDLAAPISDGIVHLQLQPAQPGENAVVVRFDEAAIDDASISVAFSPVDHEATARTVEPRPDAAGGWAVGGVDLAGEGWWRAEVTVARPAGEEVIPFYLILPDPNVNGIEAGPDPESDDAARALFERGLARWADLHRIRFSQRLTDGAGNLSLGTVALTDGTDGRPAGWQQTSGGVERIITGGKEWLREPNQSWEERPASSFIVPNQWIADYQTAQGFRLGPQVTLDGRPTQIVTFLTPEKPPPNRRTAAWFSWWVDLETGDVVREVMISNRHYMIYSFSDFDGPIIVEPPDVTPPPLATPRIDDGT